VEIVASAMVYENEISYSMNTSQDLLYIILDSYIFKKFNLHQEYFDFIDEHGSRTRLCAGQFSTINKTLLFCSKFVYVKRNILIPLVNRRSSEETAIPSTKLDKIISTKIYKDNTCPECEIKFEHYYLNRNMIDKFDSLMATKQILLYNLLKNKNEGTHKQNHLGSDEIYAVLRLEYEYELEPNNEVLDFMTNIIMNMDKICSSYNINPLLPYTTLNNCIISRKFEEEKLLYNLENVTDILKWAIKLDGIRGKGFITKHFLIIFMDNMQIFSSTQMKSFFIINNVVAFQCELIGDTIFITDILHIFKYTYNNRTQYEISMEPYNVNPVDAINCINYLGDLYHETVLVTSNNEKFRIRFQKFYDPPLIVSGYSTVPSDGFVILDHSLRYIKYKYIKTVEVEYDQELNAFRSLNGVLSNKFNNSTCVTKLEHQKIYEAVLEGDTITILKLRNDRLVPN
jgi:Late expression factor 4 (LEF-4)